MSIRLQRLHVRHWITKLVYFNMMTVPLKMHAWLDIIERMIDYRGVGLQRLHCMHEVIVTQLHLNGVYRLTIEFCSWNSLLRLWC